MNTLDPPCGSNLTPAAGALVADQKGTNPPAERHHRASSVGAVHVETSALNPPLGSGSLSFVGYDRRRSPTGCGYLLRHPRREPFLRIRV